MSESPSAPRRRRIARVLIAIFGVSLPGIGIAVFSTTPTASPNLQVPCYGETCLACLAPSQAECMKLIECGGEPCGDPSVFAPDGGIPDPYAGAAGQLARGLRRARDRDAITSWHTTPIATDGGPVDDCFVQVLLDTDQRAAWRRTIDAVGAGSDVVDCRGQGLPAKGRRGGSRLSTWAGMPTTVDAGALEAFPDDVVVDIDGGT